MLEHNTLKLFIGEMMKMLLHVCCGPCAIMPVRRLLAEGVDLFGVFVNPNIHPYVEWERRSEAAKAVASQEHFQLLPRAEYNLAEWVRTVAFREGERCKICYYMRLRHVALMAKRGKFDGFSTTLLYSKFQKHKLIREIGESVGCEAGIKFLYRDWRKDWKDGVEASRSLGIYRQQYCGCIYSEWERYAPKGG